MVTKKKNRKFGKNCVDFETAESLVDFNTVISAREIERNTCGRVTK